jgi:cytochrome c
VALSRSEKPPENPNTATRLTPALFVQFTTLFVVLMLVSGADLGLRGLHRYSTEPPIWGVAGGEPERGKLAIQKYGCGACHVVPDVRGATGKVGPDLTDFRMRMYVAGVLPNSPQHLIAWIRDPQAIDPETAMPTLGVTEADAQHITALLLGTD